MSSMPRTTTAEGQNRGPSALLHSRDSCRAGRVRFQRELSHAALRDLGTCGSDLETVRASFLLQVQEGIS